MRGFSPPAAALHKHDAALEADNPAPVCANDDLPDRGHGLARPGHQPDHRRRATLPAGRRLPAARRRLGGAEQLPDRHAGGAGVAGERGPRRHAHPKRTQHPRRWTAPAAAARLRPGRRAGGQAVVGPARWVDPTGRLPRRTGHRARYRVARRHRRTNRARAALRQRRRPDLPRPDRRADHVLAAGGDGRPPPPGPLSLTRFRGSRTALDRRTPAGILALAAYQVHSARRHHLLGVCSIRCKSWFNPA